MLSAAARTSGNPQGAGSFRRAGPFLVETPNMKRLQYIGLKEDGERAFKERTGIEWMPGAEHDVKDEDAEQMLRHTDVWREVPPKASKAALASAPAAAPQAQGGAGEPGLPEWAKKGIELGASDEQLEAIAQAGGPDTESGAALWRDATGTDWKPAETTAPAAKKTAAKAPAAKKTAAKRVKAK